MILNLIAGGPDYELPNELIEGKVTGSFIGIDRGTLKLLEYGYEPIAAIGDFDSISDFEFDKIQNSTEKIEISNPDKDYTDTELGLMFSIKNYNFDQINIYGATGGRIDQFMNNYLSILKKDIKPYAEKIKIIDRNNFIEYFLPGNHRIYKIDGMKYLSFNPLQPMNISLVNEKYKLDNARIEFPVSLSSNEFINDYGDFWFDSGILAIIQSKD